MTLVACAAVLTSAVALTGCKGNQNEPAKTAEVVKTEFAIALPNELRGGQHRMPSANIQKNCPTDFQGIDGIYIIPFAGTSISGSSARLGNNIHLTQSVVASDISSPSSAKVYSDVSIPLTTSSFLFYGKSAADNSSVDGKFSNGSIIAHFEDAKTTPGDFTFDLEPIKSDFGDVMTTASGDGYKLMGYLTSIAGADDSGTKWYEYDANAGLQDLFTTFSSMHGLSSFEIARVLTDLNQSLQPLVSSNTMAAAIRAAIKAGSDYVTVADGTNVVTMKSPYDNFPQSYNLPIGCVDMVWDGTNHVFKQGAYSNMASPETFVYPAQLWYFANSTIKTSNTSKKTMYDNTNEWGTILSAHSDGTSVSSRTRAVAIEDTIQYAVARLDVAVRLAESSLDDNMDNAVGNPTKRKVDCSAGFKVTGILVGGQKQVGFDFSPKGSTPYTIYDRTMNDENMKAEKNGDNYSAFNHTLVFENGTEDVMIAVELENPLTGEDFYGVDNKLIAKGSKFYVIAKLTTAGATKTGGHVFKQDYTTTAKLTLTNLRKAYNTLPDLRTPELELGFSVNLNWLNGNIYEINFE